MKQQKSRGTGELMLTLGGTALILKVTYELKMWREARFPLFDSNRERHSSQGRDGRAKIPPPALPL